MRAAALAAMLAAFAHGCRDTQPVAAARPEDSMAVMSYNLRQFRFADRDRDGQEDDFKPENEIQPLLELVAEAQPDILAVQELGDAATITLLQQRLRGAGIDFPHIDHVIGPNPHATLGILSRHPIVKREPATNQFYSIKGRSFPVQRGFQIVDVDVPGAFTVTVINVHLKSKVFHEAGQTEMRRNEARLLASLVRRLAETDPARRLIVCGDFNDAPPSAAMREVWEGTPLTDLPLTDRYGDGWTHYYRHEQSHGRIDYMLVNEPMRALWIPERSGVVRDQRTYAASDHRPLVSVFRARD